MSEETTWLDAPTHEGLWWVWDGTKPTLMQMWHMKKKRRPLEWAYREANESECTVGALPPTWKFAPAVPPAPPVPR